MVPTAELPEEGLQSGITANSFDPWGHPLREQKGRCFL